MLHRTDSNRRRSTIRGARPTRWAAVAILALAAVALGPVAPANAAGPGVLNLALTPIDLSDSSVISSIADGQHSNRITYQVQYSCTTDVCNDVQLQFSPSAADPLGVLPADRYLLQWESWVAPAGATISGTNTTGKLVNLGNLAAGASGSFTMTYLVAPDQHRDASYSSFYPDGFAINMAAVGSSPTITADATGTSAPVAWHIAVPGGANPAAGPAVAIGAPASVNTDTPTPFNLTMTGGNLFYGPGANVTGDAALNAVGSYTVVYHAPPEADIVSAEFGGVIDNVAKTVTWTVGSPANPVYAARGGWGLNFVSGFNGQGAGALNPPGSVFGDDDYALWRYRAVTLDFPGANFPAADPSGCNFATTVSSSMDVTVTYLDAAQTTKTASATRTTQVACRDPFGGINYTKAVHGGYANQFGQGDGAMVGGAMAANIPAPGAADRTALYWSVGVANRGNVPGVAIIDEPNLSQPDAPVYQIWPSGVSVTVEWVRSDGVTGTTTLASGQLLTAPGATYFVSARATTGPIAAGRIQQSDTGETWATMNYRMRISDSAPIGAQRTNNADITMTYPGYPGLDLIPLPLHQTPSRTIQFTRTSPVLAAGFTGAPVVSGGTLTPGTPVTYSMQASTSSIWPGTQIRPQLAFVAPVGWTIVPGSAAIPGAPAGVTYQYSTKVIGGVSREVVVATWPSDITPSSTATETWPTMTVQATPTGAAPTGTGAAVAQVWAGDASGNLSTITSNAYITNTNQFRPSPSGSIDPGDIDGDTSTTEGFAVASSSALTVAAPSAMQIVKELCIPNVAAPDGCDWAADTSQTHFVPVTATDITYRITVSNPSASALAGVVAYDVLPYVGDTGLLATPPSRGSEFALALQTIESVTPGVTMAYSASTNPERPEVYPGAPGAVNDWNTDPSGKQALRMTVGTLAAGASAQVVFTAALAGSPVADEKACNSVVVDSTATLPAEPLAVCVTLAEADLRIQLTEFDNLQAGRPSTLTYEVTNLGGSQFAPANVEIEIPAGLTVTDLTVDRWTCTVVGGGAAPVAGPAVLSCDPVDATNLPRELEMDEIETLSFPIVVSALSGELCTNGTVSGALFDPVDPNNSVGGCDQVAPPPAGLVIDKDDAQTATKLGAQYTYTITVTNTLLAEAVNGAVVTDTLPASLQFVSADGGGTAAGQTVTWSLAGLPPLAVVELHVTVEVLGTAVSPIVNTAGVTAPDPGFVGATLADDDSDSNVVRSLSVTKISDAATIPRSGDVVTFTVTLTNDGPGDYTVADPASVSDDLIDVVDDSLYGADAAATAGTAPVLTGTQLAWNGALAGGASVDITYTARLTGAGDRQVVNNACVPTAELTIGAAACAAVTFAVLVPPPAQALGLTGSDMTFGALVTAALAVLVGVVLLIPRRRRLG